jgi:tol-pal system protein YbgF
MNRINCLPRSIIALLAALALAGGCAPSLQKLQNETLLPEIDIVQLKENSDQALKIAQEAKLNVQTVNTRLTEMDNRLVSLSDEVSSVSLAKIEEIENRLALLIEACKDLQEQINVLEVSPRVRSGKKEGAPESPTFSPSAASPLHASTEYSSYENALKSFDKRVYEEAEKQFADLISKFPSGEYAPSAQYWIGECQFARGDYAKAIAAFQKVLTYGKSAKDDDAQLKIGLSYLKMGKNDHARQELQTLIDRYPGSEHAARAEKYLHEIK